MIHCCLLILFDLLDPIYKKYQNDETLINLEVWAKVSEWHCTSWGSYIDPGDTALTYTSVGPGPGGTGFVNWTGSSRRMEAPKLSYPTSTLMAMSRLKGTSSPTPLMVLLSPISRPSMNTTLVHEVKTKFNFSGSSPSKCPTWRLRLSGAENHPDSLLPGKSQKVSCIFWTVTLIF